MTQSAHPKGRQAEMTEEAKAIIYLTNHAAKVPNE
jgi:hypothetical protein